MSQDIRIRRIEDRDWDGIVALERGAYAPLGLSEDRAALRSRAGVSPETCFVLDAGRRLAGYLMALPYPEAAFPDLARAEVSAFRTRNLHLHDVVVAPDLRGGGLGRRLVRHLGAVAGARGYERVSLVAVGGSDAFWTAEGFVAEAGVALPEGYGPSAVYMTKASAVGPTVPTAGAGAGPRHAPLPDEVG